jgi:hypothetical protein
VLLLAAAFGVAMGLFKGSDTGLRAGIGNLSAPWLLVAFLPALRCRSVLQGAVTGLVCTLVALAGFYTAVTVVLAGHLGGGGYLVEFLVESRANRIYFIAGIVTGPVLGAVGAWTGRRGPRVARIIVGALLAGEILAVALLQGHQLAPPPLYFTWGVDDWWPYVFETVVGAAVLVTALRRGGRPGPTDALA